MITKTLPPYSGDTPTCPKCGEEDATTRYMSFGQCHHEAEVIIGSEANERLHRDCCRCGYQWDEAVAPSAEEEGLARDPA